MRMPHKVWTVWLIFPMIAIATTLPFTWPIVPVALVWFLRRNRRRAVYTPEFFEAQRRVMHEQRLRAIMKHL